MVENKSSEPVEAITPDDEPAHTASLAGPTGETDQGQTEESLLRPQAFGDQILNDLLAERERLRDELAASIGKPAAEMQRLADEANPKMEDLRRQIKTRLVAMGKDPDLIH